MLTSSSTSGLLLTLSGPPAISEGAQNRKCPSPNASHRMQSDFTKDVFIPHFTSWGKDSLVALNATRPFVTLLLRGLAR